ncbi:MAG: phosphate ABC transporter permease subunit PstC [Candidatus Dormiibacterota bacterium]|jgi:phosphate transport system permease protein
MILVRRRAGGMTTGPARVERAARGDLTIGDRVLQWVSGIAATVPLAGLGLILSIMIVWAIPAIIYSGTTFFTSDKFFIGNLYSTVLTTHNGISAPHGAVYGALTFIIGTFFTSVIALILAVPISVGGVLMLSEWIPRRLEGPLSTFLELLAGIPSVVFGFWGLTVLGPLLSQHFYPVLSHLGAIIPFFKGPWAYNGQGMLTASLVLTLMIIPIIASTTRELVKRVPVLAREGALALGMSRYEMVRVVTIPYVRTGIIASALLGWGRALGETIAVLLIIGVAFNPPANIYGTTSTLASVIANQLDEALSDFTGMAVRAIAELGLLLLIISLLTNLAGRLIVRRISGEALPVGRGI